MNLEIQRECTDFMKVSGSAQISITHEILTQYFKMYHYGVD